jgi:hypothetical protein
LGATAIGFPAFTASHSTVVCDQYSFDFTTRLKLNRVATVAACSIAAIGFPSVTAKAAATSIAAKTMTTITASAAVTGVAAVDTHIYDVTTETSSAAVAAESSPAVSAGSARPAVTATKCIFGETAFGKPPVTATHRAAVCDPDISLATTRLK